MTRDIANELAAVERQLATQDCLLAEVAHELSSMPEGVQIALDDQWKDDFERATEVRQAPAPIPQLTLVRV